MMVPAASDCTSLERLVFLGDWNGRGWITSPGGPYMVQKGTLDSVEMLMKVWNAIRYSQEDREDQWNQCLLLHQQGPGWNMKRIFKQTPHYCQSDAIKNTDSTHGWTFGSLGTLGTLHETGHKLSNLTKSLKMQLRMIMNDWIHKRLTGRPGGPGGPRGPAAPLMPCDMTRWKQKTCIYIYI